MSTSSWSSSARTSESRRDASRKGRFGEGDAVADVWSSCWEWFREEVRRRNRRENLTMLPAKTMDFIFK